MIVTYNDGNGILRIKATQLVMEGEEDHFCIWDGDRHLDDVLITELISVEEN